MKTVMIIAGAYGADNGRHGVTVIERGQTCQVDDAEAKRLIALGVAAEAVATAPERVETPDAVDNPPAAENPQERAGIASDPERLLKLTNAELRKLAEEMGLDPSGCKKKADYVELITSADEDGDTVDDGELPPALEAEVPTV